MSKRTSAGAVRPFGGYIVNYYYNGVTRSFPNGRTLKLQVGDITKVSVDAMCNAANSGLHGGGGVDGAIHRAGGRSIMKELDAIRATSGGCPTGSAVATSAGALPAKYVFHAVGPIWHGGNRGEADLLASCYRTCLKLADERGVETISFPAISTGIYGYPIADAARIALGVVSDYLGAGKGSVREAIFVLFDQRSYDTWSKQAP